MTEQETREKIFNVKKRRYSTHTEPSDDDELADALIAAGIGDVTEWKEKAKKHRVQVLPDGTIKQLYSDEEVEDIARQRDEYKHRAEVAERELERYTVLIKPLEAENARLNHLAARAKRALKDL